MLVLRALEILLAVLVAIGVVSQIVIPLFQGLPLFPAFRRTGDLGDALARMRQETQEAELESEIIREAKRAEEIRKQNEAAMGEELKTEGEAEK